jgi:hypothetical protein
LSLLRAGLLQVERLVPVLPRHRGHTHFVSELLVRLLPVGALMPKGALEEYVESAGYVAQPNCKLSS